jgi:thiol-disulfide isomerase/thioredoxin
VRPASLPRLVACLAALAGCSPAVLRSATLPSLDKVAAFSAPDERGDLTRVPGGGARATILELWATSCAPCQKALPALAAEAPGLSRDGVELVLVSVLESAEPLDGARAMLRSWGVGRGFVVDRGGGVQRALGAGGLPATVVLDRRGVVRWVAPPGASADAVAAAARWVASSHL